MTPAAGRRRHHLQPHGQAPSVEIALLRGDATSGVDGVTARAPAGNVDIAPTILALNGIRGRTDGRVLAEAFENGPDEETIDGDSRVLRTSADGGRCRAAIRVSELEDGRYRYIDKSWRLR